MEGTVVSIFISPNAGEPMERVEGPIRLIAGKGLEGDRYAEGRGFYQQEGMQEKVRQISIITAAAVSRANQLASGIYGWGDTRRNVVVANVSPEELTSVIGRGFTFRGTRLWGTEECTPCTRPSVLAKKGEFATHFRNIGGIRAEVLEDGDLKHGDMFQAEDPRAIRFSVRAIGAAGRSSSIGISHLEATHPEFLKGFAFGKANPEKFSNFEGKTDAWRIGCWLALEAADVCLVPFTESQIRSALLR